MLLCLMQLSVFPLAHDVPLLNKGEELVKYI